MKMKNYRIIYVKSIKNGYKEYKKYADNAQKAFNIVMKIENKTSVHNIRLYLDKENYETGYTKSILLICKK